MPTPKLNPSRSISVIPSSYCNIPNPALFITDVQAVDVAVGSCTLVNLNTATSTIKIGDIIYGYSDFIGATITSVLVTGPNDLEITYNNPLAFSESASVQVYNGEDDSTGCVLYIGAGGAVSVITEGGDDVVFGGVPGGSFFPVQVLRVKNDQTGATDILALR
jgi:hypothetical protein